MDTEKTKKIDTNSPKASTGSYMRKPNLDMSIFKNRRELLKEKLKSLSTSPALILTSHPECLRNHDVHFPYRQDSNFFYLSGFEEPESVIVFRPGLTPEFTMFVRPRDPLRETWDGFRYGPELTEKYFGADKCYLIDE